MYKQTQYLAQVMPHCASVFRDADRRDSAEWEFVQWRDVAPSDVRPEQVETVHELILHGQRVPNRFPNRTAALRFAQRLASEKRLERDWVLRWREGSHTHYQTVFPVNRRSGAGAIAKGTTARGGSTLVRMSEASHRLLKKVAAREGCSLQSALEKAVEAYDRVSFFKHLDREYKALRADPEAWREEEEERQLLEGTLMDGLSPDDWPQRSGSERERKRA